MTLWCCDLQNSTLVGWLPFYTFVLIRLFWEGSVLCVCSVDWCKNLNSLFALLVKWNVEAVLWKWFYSNHLGHNFRFCSTVATVTKASIISVHPLLFWKHFFLLSHLRAAICSSAYSWTSCFLMNQVSLDLFQLVWYMHAVQNWLWNSCSCVSSDAARQMGRTQHSEKLQSE